MLEQTQQGHGVETGPASRAHILIPKSNLSPLVSEDANIKFIVPNLKAIL